MGIGATFVLDNREVLGALNRLGSGVPRALARAVNKSAKSARTAQVKAVREDVGGLKAKDVRDAIRIEEARPDSNPAAKLTVSKRRLPLIKFGGTQLKRAGWRSRLKGGTKTIPGAFQARMPSGHVGVFKRRIYPGGPRLHVDELKGPSLAKSFAKTWPANGRARYREQLPKNLAHELRFETGR